MSAEEIQLISHTIAFHPLAVIGGLMVLIFISRQNYYHHQQKVKLPVEGAVTLESNELNKSEVIKLKKYKEK